MTKEIQRLNKKIKAAERRGDTLLWFSLCEERRALVRAQQDAEEGEPEIEISMGSSGNMILPPACQDNKILAYF